MAATVPLLKRLRILACSSCCEVGVAAGVGAAEGSTWLLGSDWELGCVFSEVPEVAPSGWRDIGPRRQKSSTCLKVLPGQRLHTQGSTTVTSHHHTETDANIRFPRGPLQRL